MADCPKFAKQCNLEKDPDAEKYTNCNTTVRMKKTVISVRIWKTAHPSGPIKLKNGTTTTNFVQGLKLETPRLRTRNEKVETSKPQDDWQRQVESISIQLIQLTTEPDSSLITPQTIEQDISQESFYELLRNASDNYFANPHEATHPKMDVTPQIHHTSITNTCENTHSSCNEPKQPLLDDDVANHVQVDKERNLSYLLQPL